MGICRVRTVVNSKAFLTMQRFLLGVALCMVLFLSVQTSANQDGATLLNDLIDEAPLTQDVEKATEPIVDIDNAMPSDDAVTVGAEQNAQVNTQNKVKGKQGWHVHHRHRPHVHHRHRPHIHHRHRPHIHISLSKMLSSVSNAFKYLGGKFKDLYNWFKQMFGSAFKLPKLSFRGISHNFMKAVNGIKKGVADLTRKVKGEEEMLLAAKDEWSILTGGLGVVKQGTKKGGILKVITDGFCKVIHYLVSPIKRAFNAVMKLVTGIIPSWLIKIAAFGGIGFLSSFLFSAFTIGGGWSASYGVAVTSFEAGFGLEVKSNLQIGYTGCYLAGSSGLTQSVGPPSPGMAAAAFKKWGNIAGDSATLAIEGDLCKFFGLPCKFSIAPALVWDNSDFNNGNSVALKTFKTCLAPGAEYLHEIENLELTHEMAVNMVQTLSKEELEANILKAAYNFFKNGFNRLKNCIVAIFKLWIGFVIDLSAGVQVSLPVKLTFTLDYTYMHEVTR